MVWLRGTHEGEFDQVSQSLQRMRRKLVLHLHPQTKANRKRSQRWQKGRREEGEEGASSRIDPISLPLPLFGMKNEWTDQVPRRRGEKFFGSGVREAHFLGVGGRGLRGGDGGCWWEKEREKVRGREGRTGIGGPVGGFWEGRDGFPSSDSSVRGEGWIRAYPGFRSGDREERRREAKSEERARSFCGQRRTCRKGDEMGSRYVSKMGDIWAREKKKGGTDRHKEPKEGRTRSKEG